MNFILAAFSSIYETGDAVIKSVNLANNEPINGRLIASAQAGPMLLPDLRLEEEFFIVRNENGSVIRESASVLHKCARTLIGLKGKTVHIFIVTTEHPMDNIRTLGDKFLEFGFADITFKQSVHQLKSSGRERILST